MSITPNFSSKMALEKSKKMALEIQNICQIDNDVLDAISKSQRALFVPKGFERHAYRLDALPLVADQWISSPLTVAKMTTALTCKGADSILEIGCGSGYQALILSKLIRRVFSIERVERLAKEAKGRFKKLGIHNINIRFDDGQNGWRDFAPFDRILFSASTKEIPQKIFDQLAINGVLVAPIEIGDKQIITRFTKTDNGIKEERLDDCLFVPVKDGKIR
jgi:protein-L-isoaspartate(D-aspartate) O-methyltransferase